nr:hypothetical protein [Candidatus Sigynarchaeota archaeon]
MMFKTKKPMMLWDNWLYYWNGKYYLFYLANMEGQPWDSFGVAVSNEAVHWKDHGIILRKDPKATWMGTGHVWKSTNFAADKKFIINYSEWHGPNETGQQHIFFAESTDLLHWTKLGHRFGPDERWYHVNRGDKSRWDTINPLPRLSGGYYGFWTATPKSHPAGIGFGESDDGIHWRALPAPDIDWGSNPVPSSIEIGGVEKLGNKYYNMIGAMFPNAGGGMYLLEASDPAGPYVAVKRNYDLLTSGHGWTYYSRFFPGPDGLFVNHQSIEDFSKAGMQRVVHVAPIKKAWIDEAGTFFLAYWERNDGLKDKGWNPTWNGPAKRGELYLQDCLTAIDSKKGIVLESDIAIPGKESDHVGIFFEVKLPIIGDHVYFAALIGKSGALSLGILDPLDGSFEEIDAVARPHLFNHTGHLRVLNRGGLIEIYLDNILLQCATMPHPPTGKFGIVAGPSNTIASAFKQISVWTMQAT